MGFSKKIFAYIFYLAFIIAGIYLNICPLQVSGGIDKLYHFTAFTVFTFLSAHVFLITFDRKYLNMFFFFFSIIGIILATLSEYVQTFIVARTCNYDDWAFNTFGIFFAIAVIFFVNVRNSMKDDPSYESIEEHF